MKNQVVEDIRYLIVDLFCGAGGVTEGIEKACLDALKLAKVIACVNHDPLAIESHAANHIDVLHFTEDIKKLHKRKDRMQILIDHVAKWRKAFPNAKLIIWASLECTHFSKAKGGESRDEDSRTLAKHLFPYVEALDPDGLWIENVREFMSWGPLITKVVRTKKGSYSPIKYDKKEKVFKPIWVPESRTKGRYYVRWCNILQRKYGFRFDWKLLKAADFGAYTTRERFFAQFAKNGLDIVWPEPTHVKTPENTGFFQSKKKWKPVRDVLDLQDHGNSIFMRKKPLVEATLKRIYAGMVKFIANGDESFLQSYYSGDPGSKVLSLDSPSPALTTVPHEGLVKACFIHKYNSNSAKTGINSGASLDKPSHTICTQVRMNVVFSEFLMQYNGNNGAHYEQSTDQPCGTLTTKDRFGVIKPDFLIQYNGKAGYSEHQMEKPCPTLVTKDKFGLVNTQWMDRQYGSGTPYAPIHRPCDTLMKVPKQRLCTAHWLDKQYSGDKNHQSVDRPADTVTGNPKLCLCYAHIMPTHFDNIGHEIDRPIGTLTADRHWHYLLNPQFGDKGRSIDDPCFTLIAKMDKRPPYIVSTDSGEGMIVIYPSDCETMVKIKLFMATYGITDIKMRMLKIRELKRITGLPEDYILKGTKADQKKFIGNAVVPVIPQRMIEANARYAMNVQEEKTLVA